MVIGEALDCYVPGLQGQGRFSYTAPRKEVYTCQPFLVEDGDFR